MKLTAVVIEDEYKLREVFITLLEKHCPEIEVIGEASNITEGSELIIFKKPDVVFLDIEMPHGNGFDLLSKFEQIPFEIVFVSSYEQYAIRALKLSALDFILKPVEIEDLFGLAERIRQSIKLKESAFKYDLLQANLNSSEQDKKIILPGKKKMECIYLKNIIYLKAEQNYTTIYSMDKNRIVIAKILKEFEGTLCEENSDFVRIHKSYIVNIRYIRKFVRNEDAFIILEDGTRLEVSRRKKTMLISRLNIPVI